LLAFGSLGLQLVKYKVVKDFYLERTKIKTILKNQNVLKKKLEGFGFSNIFI
jgi:hypothetical protein